MKLSGHTRPYAVLGHPIGHTLSPVMHNAAFRALGRDAIYLAFDVAPEHLPEVLPAMRNMGFGGVNLTVPLKEVACRSLENVDPAARRLGAVNTVAFTDNGLKGYNTDGGGFLRAIDEAFGGGIEGLSVFILGCGGAGRALAITCASGKAARLTLTDAMADRPRQVKDEIGRMECSVPVQTVDATPDAWANACRQADLVIQATTVGMKPDDPPLLPAAAFRKGQRLFDLVYMYPETGIMKEARNRGARVSNGLGMLLHQGALAFSIWTGIEPPVAEMRKALENEVYGISTAVPGKRTSG